MSYELAAFTVFPVQPHASYGHVSVCDARRRPQANLSSSKNICRKCLPLVCPRRPLPFAHRRASLRWPSLPSMETSVAILDRPVTLTTDGKSPHGRSGSRGFWSSPVDVASSRQISSGSDDAGYTYNSTTTVGHQGTTTWLYAVQRPITKITSVTANEWCHFVIE